MEKTKKIKYQGDKPLRFRIIKTHKEYLLKKGDEIEVGEEEYKEIMKSRFAHTFQGDAKIKKTDKKPGGGIDG